MHWDCTSTCVCVSSVAQLYRYPWFPEQTTPYANWNDDADAILAIPVPRRVHDVGPQCWLFAYLATSIVATGLTSIAKAAGVVC